MFQDESSPFDQALANPFIANEKSPKRWSLRTETTSDTSSDSLSEAEGTPEGSYKAPIEEITFTIDDGDEEGAFVLAMEEGNLDRALLQERNQGIREIRDSMLTIKDIQSELANVVNSQDEHVNAFQSMAVESLAVATKGYNELARMQQQAASSRRRRRQMIAGVGGLLMVGMLHFWMVQGEHAEEGSPSTP
jgi:hypothetical protein